MKEQLFKKSGHRSHLVISQRGMERGYKNIASARKDDRRGRDYRSARSLWHRNNGYTGFNEPGSSHPPRPVRSCSITLPALRTRRTFRIFPGVASLGDHDGISTTARILLMAWGRPRPSFKKRFEWNPTEQHYPPSLLQQHNDRSFVADEWRLPIRRGSNSWLTGECEWTPQVIRKAVVNMALKSGN